MNAVSGTAPPLFVFKGTRMPYRTKIESGIEIMETIADCFPTDSVISFRRENGGLDSANFLAWAKHFIQFLQARHTCCTTSLRILDGYRAHISIDVLELFDNSNVIVYALPSHTSGKTQPLDVTVFPSLKAALNDVINKSVSNDKKNEWDVFSFCKMLKFAYQNEFKYRSWF